MSVPFSNAHLHIPRGFGDLLEGLAREVLRDQPKDIPEFAALYFTRLLGEREDSGMDPAEWAARDDDRYYNYTFKAKQRSADASGTGEPGLGPQTSQKEEPESLEKRDGEMIVPVHVSTVSSANFDIFEEVSGIDGENVNDSDERITLVPRSDGDICAVELEEHEGRVASADMCTDELSGPDGGIEGVDICAEELKEHEDGVAKVDTCAEELRSSEEGKASEGPDTDETRMDIADSTISDFSSSIAALDKDFTEEAETDVPETGTDSALITKPKEGPQEQVTEEHTPVAEAEGEPGENMSETADQSNQELMPEEGTADVINPDSENNQEEACNQPQEEDIMDIPLDDPEANKAATKIQAGFRGHMTRKKMKDDKPREEVSSSGEPLNGRRRDSGAAGSEEVEGDDTSTPEQ